jgi:hypothetical protein
VPTMCAAMAMNATPKLAAHSYAHAKKPVAANKAVKAKSKKAKKFAPVMSKKITLKSAAIKKFKHRFHKARH